MPERACLVSPQPLLLFMERKYFSAERELRALFAASAGQFGGGGEEEKERPNAQMDNMYEQ